MGSRKSTIRRVFQLCQKCPVVFSSCVEFILSRQRAERAFVPSLVTVSPVFSLQSRITKVITTNTAAQWLSQHQWANGTRPLKPEAGLMSMVHRQRLEKE